MDNTDILKDLDLNDKEINIYTTLLSAGPSPVSQIARETSIKRPSVYFNLSRLTQKGLVSQTIAHKREVYKAEDPTVLERHLQQRIEKIRHLQTSLKKLLPALKSLNQTKDIFPKIKIIEGSEGIWSVAEDILAEKKDFYVFGSFKKIYQFYPKKRIEDFDRRRRIRHIKAYYLTEKYQESLDSYFKNDIQFQEYRFVPDDLKLDTYLILYGNKTGILLTVDEPLMGVIIENKTLTNAIKVMYDALWRGLDGRNLPLPLVSQNLIH